MPGNTRGSRGDCTKRWNTYTKTMSEWPCLVPGRAAGGSMHSFYTALGALLVPLHQAPQELLRLSLRRLYRVSSSGKAENRKP